MRQNGCCGTFCSLFSSQAWSGNNHFWMRRKNMKRVSRIVASAALAGSLLAVCGGTASAANLLVDPGFETPSANPTDVVLPTTQAGAALNPTFPLYDPLTT